MADIFYAYCNVDDKALLCNDSVSKKGSVATVVMQWLSTHVSTMAAKMFSVG
jgi:hypothetical protein